MAIVSRQGGGSPDIPVTAKDIDAAFTTHRTSVPIGQYGRTKYGRCRYGARYGIYGHDQYQQAQYL